MTPEADALETLTLEVRNVGRTVSILAASVIDKQQYLADPLFGVASHLERISQSLDDLASADKA